uniref:LysR family transcriptional regulator n=1 Tax=uncultured Sphingomonas sp. TaxID=158754 RepID=UPI0035CB8378
MLHIGSADVQNAHMLDWNDLRYFLAVAETGSTLAAGRQLRVSQTTAARRVAALEEALMVTLFERRSSGYRLTDQGRALVPIARDMAVHAERLVDAAAASMRDTTGTVRLTVPEIYAVTVLAPILRALHETHGRIRVDLDTSDEVRDLAAGAADIALRVCVRPSGAGLVGRRVGTDNWAVYCSHSYAADHGQPHRRSDLRGHTFVGGGEAGFWTYYRAWLERNDLLDAIAVQHDSSTGILSSVRAGIGIAALPCLIADQDPDLTRCLPPAPENERGLWLLFHERSRGLPHVRATVDFLGEKLSRLSS